MYSDCDRGGDYWDADFDPTNSMAYWAFIYEGAINSDDDDRAREAIDNLRRLGVTIDPSELHRVDGAEERGAKKMLDPKRELLTRDEACSLLRVSPATLWRCAIEGKLKSVNIGRKVLYRRAELDRFIAASSGSR